MALFAGFAVESRAAVDIIDQEQVTTIISLATGNTLHVVNGAGEMLRIYNIAGECVKSFKVDGPDRRYDLSLPRGIYIVKVGKTARRIIVK